MLSIAVTVVAAVVASSQERGPDMVRPMGRALSAEEERIIVHGGTEAPFVGAYVDTVDTGTYLCRRCGAPLYRSEDKFHSGCGWPAFDEELAGSVRRRRDPDGQRTEILCQRCGGHLGHVFEGERLTPRNVRHCVNSLSMEFLPDPTDGMERAVFAGGCFWGVEYWLSKEPGVLSVVSGYTGGWTPSPTYEQVCGHETGHLEAVEVVFDPALTTFERLAKRFFEIHDPTQADGQGPDRGEQYTSAIFYRSRAQREVAERLVAELRGRGLDVVTAVRPGGRFWPAETHHQDFYDRRGVTPSCHGPVKRF